MSSLTWDNALPWQGVGDRMKCEGMNVCLHLFLCACSDMHSCVCMRRIKRRRQSRKIINWAFLCAATLYDVLHNREWKIPLAAPSPSPECMNPERTTHQTSNRATTLERLSCQIGRKGSWCLLTFQDGQTHQPTLASLCGVALFQSPTPPPVHFLFSLNPLPTSRWIFSHSPTLKALLTSLCGSESEEKMCDVAGAPGYAERTALISQCEQTPKKE